MRPRAYPSLQFVPFPATDAVRVRPALCREAGLIQYSRAGVLVMHLRPAESVNEPGLEVHKSARGMKRLKRIGGTTTLGWAT